MHMRLLHAASHVQSMHAFHKCQCHHVGLHVKIICTSDSSIVTVWQHRRQRRMARLQWKWSPRPQPEHSDMPYIAVCRNLPSLLRRRRAIALLPQVSCSFCPPLHLRYSCFLGRATLSPIVYRPSGLLWSIVTSMLWSIDSSEDCLAPLTTCCIRVMTSAPSTYSQPHAI